MPGARDRCTLWAKKGGTVQNWMSFVDWTRMAVAMVAWIALIACVGYAAVLAARR
jgi:hypothetical protein